MLVNRQLQEQLTFAASESLHIYWAIGFKLPWLIRQGMTPMFVAMGLPIQSKHWPGCSTAKSSLLVNSQRCWAGLLMPGRQRPESQSTKLLMCPRSYHHLITFILHLSRKTHASVPSAAAYHCSYLSAVVMLYFVHSHCFIKSCGFPCTNHQAWFL